MAKKTNNGPLKMLRRWSQSLEVKLTDEELLERGKQLAAAHEDHGNEERRQADLKAQMKARLAEIEARQAQLTIVVSRGEELRDVDVEEWANFDSGVVERVRTDTGQVIGRRALSEAERQQDLPIDKPAA